jgi:hypothetical protein
VLFSFHYFVKTSEIYNLSGGKICIGLQFQFMVTWHHCFCAHGEAQHYGREYVVEEGCSSYDIREERDRERERERGERGKLETRYTFQSHVSPHSDLLLPPSMPYFLIDYLTMSSSMD